MSSVSAAPAATLPAASAYVSRKENACGAFVPDRETVCPRRRLPQRSNTFAQNCFSTLPRKFSPSIRFSSAVTSALLDNLPGLIDRQTYTYASLDNHPSQWQPPSATSSRWPRCSTASSSSASAQTPRPPPASSCPSPPSKSCPRPACSPSAPAAWTRRASALPSPSSLATACSFRRSVAAPSRLARRSTRSSGITSCWRRSTSREAVMEDSA